MERRIILTERLQHQGVLLAAEPPAWSRPLGPVPGVEGELRTLWERTAALVEVWRQRHGLDESAMGLGPQPEEPRDAHAWAVFQERVDLLGRRTRAWAAAVARPDDPSQGMRIAARTAENLLMRLLESQVTDEQDRGAVSAAAAAFAAVALFRAMASEEPAEEWVQQIPAPDAEDVDQQQQWRELVTALASYRMVHQTESADPLGECPDEEGQRLVWSELQAALTLFQRSRIQQRLAEISALRDAERAHHGLAAHSAARPSPESVPGRRSRQRAEDEQQRQQSGPTSGPRRGPGT